MPFKVGHEKEKRGSPLSQNRLLEIHPMQSFGSERRSKNRTYFARLSNSLLACRSAVGSIRRRQKSRTLNNVTHFQICNQPLSAFYDPLDPIEVSRFRKTAYRLSVDINLAPYQSFAFQFFFFFNLPMTIIYKR